MAYRFRYVDKSPEAFTTIETQMGRVVHEVIHWAYADHDNTADVPARLLEERFHKLWDELDWEGIRIVRAGRRREEYFQEGLRMITGFCERVMSGDRRISTHLEASFCIELDKETQFRGVVDRIARGPEGSVQVIDYKTGRTVEPFGTLQLPAYALFAFQEFPGLTRIEICFEDLRKGITRSAFLEKAEASAIQNRILNAIRPLREAEDFPARPSGLCRWCGYGPMCPAFAQPSGREKSPGDSFSQLDGACPQCGSPLAERSGKFGRFLGCTAFPECRYAVNLEDGGGEPAAETPEREICPECGRRLRERRGRFGAFIGCSGYPECRYSRDSW